MPFQGRLTTRTRWITVPDSIRWSFVYHVLHCIQHLGHCIQHLGHRASQAVPLMPACCNLGTMRLPARTMMNIPVDFIALIRRHAALASHHLGVASPLLQSSIHHQASQLIASNVQDYLQNTIHCQLVSSFVGAPIPVGLETSVLEPFRLAYPLLVDTTDH